MVGMKKNHRTDEMKTPTTSDHRPLFLLIPLLLLLLASHVYALDLNYWIEPSLNGSPEKVWIKIPYIPANGSVVVYATPEAGYTPNPEGVFEFFDDFEGTTLDTTKWTVSSTYTALTTSVSNSVLTIEGTSTTAWGLLYSTKTFSPPVILEMNAEINAGVTNWAGLRSPDDSVDLVDYKDGYFRTASAGSSTSATFSTGLVTTWHKSMIVWTQTEANLYINGTLVSSKTDYIPTIPLAIEFETEGLILKVDWVFVRKYAQKEPTITVVNKGTYYEITITNPNSTDLTDFQVAIPASDINVTSTTESIHFSDTPFSNLAVSIAHTPTEQNQLALDPENGVNEVNVTYTATITAIDVNITYWKWIENGTTIEEDNTDINTATLTRTYTQIGDYNVCFYVKGEDSTGVELNDEDCTQVHIDEYPQGVDFDWNQHIPFPNETITFTGQATDNGTLTYSWDFGDGNTGSENPATHSYTDANDYNVVMTVCDDVGLCKSTSKIVKVYDYNVSVTKPQIIEKTDQTLRFYPSDNWDLNYISVKVYYDGNLITPIYSRIGYKYFATWEMGENNANEENHNAFWEFNVCTPDGLYCRDFNTPAVEFNSYKMVLTDCSTLTTTQTLLYKVYNEDNIAEEVSTATIDGIYTVSNEKGFSREYGLRINEGGAVCIYPSWASYTLNAQLSYYADTYVQRQYVITNATIDGNVDTVNLYLLPTSVAQAVTIKVQNPDGSPVTNAVVKILRLYFADNQFRAVAVQKTDATGQLTVYLKPLEFYKYIVEVDGKVVLETGTTQLTQNTITLTIPGETPAWYTEYGINVKCEENLDDVNNMYVECFVSDPSNVVAQATLTLERVVGVTSAVVCTDTSEGSGFSTYCKIPDATADYRYTLTIVTKNGNTFTGASGYLPISGNPLSSPFILFLYVIILMGADVILLQYPVEVFALIHTILVALGTVIGIIPTVAGWIIWIGGLVIVAILKRNVITEG